MPKKRGCTREDPSLISRWRGAGRRPAVAAGAAETLYSRGGPATRHLAEECVRADPHARGGAEYALANIRSEDLADQDICTALKRATAKTT
jgi:hypothetical protein